MAVPSRMSACAPSSTAAAEPPRRWAVKAWGARSTNDARVAPKGATCVDKSWARAPRAESARHVTAWPRPGARGPHLGSGRSEHASYYLRSVDCDGDGAAETRSGSTASPQDRSTGATASDKVGPATVATWLSPSALITAMLADTAFAHAMLKALRTYGGPATAVPRRFPSRSHSPRRWRRRSRTTPEHPGRCSITSRPGCSARSYAASRRATSRCSKTAVCRRRRSAGSPRFTRSAAPGSCTEPAQEVRGSGVAVATASSEGTAAIIAA